MRNIIIIFTFLFLYTSSQFANSSPQSFHEAKKFLPKIYQDMESTIYCGCDYTHKGKKLIPDLNSCGYQVRKREKRANRIEWEHIVPSEHSGRGRSCWRDRDKYPECKKADGKLVYGRKCCKKVDPEFRKLSGNLHNLAPSIGEINADRSNFRFSQLPFKVYQYGSCQSKTDFNGRKFEPRDEVKGDVARVNFYFEAKGYINFSESQRKLFEVWDKKDPVDDYECTIHDRKSKIQGEVNPFVADKCNR